MIKTIKRIRDNKLRKKYNLSKEYIKASVPGNVKEPRLRQKIVKHYANDGREFVYTVTGVYSIPLETGGFVVQNLDLKFSHVSKKF